jgi:predicted amidohydrolase YtcJ
MNFDYFLAGQNIFSNQTRPLELKMGISNRFIVISKLLLIMAILFSYSACSPQVNDAEGNDLPEDSSSEDDSNLTVIQWVQGEDETGLFLDSGGSSDTEVVTAGDPPAEARRLGNCEALPAADGNEEGDCDMQFLVDDEILFAGSPTTRVRIEVEYLDQGTDVFFVWYDATHGVPFGEGTKNETDNIVKTNTGEFKTAVFILEDAYFGNGLFGGDFRIDGRDDGEEIIRSVKVTLLEPFQESAADPEGIADFIFYNGIVITMEDEQPIAEAIAVVGDKILAVGDNYSVLGYQDSQTKLIDLAGKTLMPGFVDTHTHWMQSVKRDDLEGGQAELLAYGITTSAELFVDDLFIEELFALEEAGKLRMRISLYLVHVDNCGDLWGEWYWPDYPVSLEPGALIQIPGLKMFNDGGSCNAPAKSFEYPGGGFGDLYYQAEELVPMILQAQERGYQVAIHGLGDRAIEEIMDAYEIVFDGGPNTYRHRLEHNTLVRDDMLERYTELDLVGNIFGYYVGCMFVDGRFAPSPEEYQHWEWRWRSLLDANPDVHFAWHSDAPLGRPNTMENIHSFITRLDYREDGSVCEPPDWAADDILTIEEVLPMMTIEGAYALLRDHEIGSLKEGKLADLIILSDDLLDVPTEQIRDVQILMTMVGGSVEHCLSGHEDYCP